MNKHILFIVENNSVPGDVRVWSEALAAKEYGYDVSVICPVRKKSAPNKYEQLEGIDIYRHSMPFEAHGITGFFIVIATFIPGGGWIWHLIAWVVAALILIPWSILDLRRIAREEWVDIPLDEQGHPLPGAL